MYFQVSLTQLSVDSRMTFTQVFARTGSYKGQIVALKMYEKHNLYISRKMQKEMKLVRFYTYINNILHIYFYHYTSVLEFVFFTLILVIIDKYIDDILLKK